MHHNLSRFIQGIRLENPSFDWQPQPWHSKLAEHIPASAVYGLFGEAIYDGEVLQVRDDFGKIERFRDAVKAVLGDVRVEYVK